MSEALEKSSFIYSGKSKSLYKTAQPELAILEFRDDATAFNGVKKASLAHKGIVNNYFNAFIMNYLESAGISTQFVEIYGDNASIVKQLEMLKVECVVRNYSAGGLAKRLGIEEGINLDPPIFEFFLKNDELGDPLINDSIIQTFNWATVEEINLMRTRSMEINNLLKPLFLRAGLLLIDFKLEFGRYKGELLLGDEFTPDGCRIWDAKTHEKLDKDRFRRDLGNVIEGYEEVARRLGIKLPY